VSPERQEHFRRSRVERAKIEALLTERFTGAALNKAGVGVRDDGVRRSLGEWLRFPELDAVALTRIVPELSACGSRELEEAVQDHRYAPYVARQQGEVERLRSDEAVRLPPDLDYAAIPGLSNEMTERLSLARPATLGAASRIRGITPAALAAILVRARRKAA
jgi:tRNA uridine 5-carboxymethylaminomethyl modification enzyme